MAPNLPKLKRRPLGQEVTMILRDMIQKGEIQPGQRLVEEKLAKELGLSRTPVREALHRLEQEGLLTKPARGGYEVHPLTEREIQEAVGVRAVLEAYAAELASMRISDQALEEMKANLESFGRALHNRDEARLLELNSEFHDQIHRAADSKLLYRLLSELREEVDRISRMVMTNMNAGEWSEEEHRRCFEALSKRDGDEASRILKNHVLRARDHLLSYLKSDAGQKGE